MRIYIKNMACESCKIVVRTALEELEITAINIQLGEIQIKGDITEEDKHNLNIKLKKAGLEILENKNGLLIEKIRAVVVDYVYNTDEKPVIKFSVLLSQKLGHKYGYLSNFFSEVETTTIEQYVIALKVERAKELILFGDDSLSDIAYKLHYSSVAHLSTQFKKITGLSPTHFKDLKEKRRRTIQEV